MNAFPRVAAIDVGTNSIKLLVAEREDRGLASVFEDSRTTRLGEGVGATSQIKPAAMERTVTAIAEFASHARSLGAQQILAVATSCVRDADNRDEFLQRVHAEVGVEVDVISGEREAELIFAGVCCDSRFSQQSLLVMDVGGGSAEFIAGANGRIEHRRSIPAGAVRMTERFLHSDPVKDAELEQMLHLLGEMIRPALANASPSLQTMVGTGGAITTAAAMDLQLTQFDLEKIGHHTLLLQRLEYLLDRVCRLPLALRRTLPGLPPSRADIIVAGLAAFIVAMKLSGVSKISVSTRGLRFGLLAEKCSLLSSGGTDSFRR